MTEVTDATFQKEVVEESKKGIMVLIIAYASWCPDSKRMLDIIESVEPTYTAKAKMVKIEIERNRGDIKNPLVREAFEVTIYPKLVVFKNGKFMAERLSQGSSSQQLRDVKKMIASFTSRNRQ